jgi:hypothetical protein
VPLDGNQTYKVTFTVPSSNGHGKETASGALLVQADNADPEVVTDSRRM